MNIDFSHFMILNHFYTLTSLIFYTKLFHKNLKLPGTHKVSRRIFSGSICGCGRFLIIKFRIIKKIFILE